MWRGIAEIWREKKLMWGGFAEFGAKKTDVGWICWDLARKNLMRGGFAGVWRENFKCGAELLRFGAKKVDEGWIY